MARVIRYVPNPAFEQGVRSQAEHQKGMHSITKGVARHVRAVAPHKTGYYKRKVSVRGTRIRTLDVFWHLVEFGSVNNPAYSPLRRGVRAAGLRLVVHPRP